MISKIIYKNLLYKRIKPLFALNRDDHLFDHYNDLNIPSLSLYEGRNVLLEEDGSIHDSNGLFLPSLRYPKTMKNHYTKWNRLKRYFSFKEIVLDQNKNYATVIDYLSSEYYHWLLEACGRLSVLQDQSIDFTLILSDRQNRSYHNETLKLFGIKDIIYLKSKTRVNVAKLFFCDFQGPPDIHRPEVLLSLKAKLTKDLQLKPAKKIYLSRQKAEKRKIINFEEVERELHLLGYDTVYAEELSFNHQREIFSKCSHLVTVHGAGLTNLIFMPENSVVLELRKDCYGEGDSSELYNTYYHLALMTNIKYGYLACPSIDKNESAHTADLEVNIAELKERLMKI